MAHQDNAVRTVTSDHTLEDLYLAERQRRNAVRGRVSIPATIIAFLMFGHVSFVGHMEIGDWSDVLTIAMVSLIGASLLLLLVSVGLLVGVELRFLGDGLPRIEDPSDAMEEREYLATAYDRMRRTNERAERSRSWSSLFILAAITVFVLAVALLPFHKTIGG